MNLLEQLGKIEETVTRLDKYAKEGDGLIAPKLHEGLRTLTAGLHTSAETPAYCIVDDTDKEVGNFRSLEEVAVHAAKTLAKEGKGKLDIKYNGSHNGQQRVVNWTLTLLRH